MCLYLLKKFVIILMKIIIYIVAYAYVAKDFVFLIIAVAMKIVAGTAHAVIIIALKLFAVKNFFNKNNY